MPCEAAGWAGEERSRSTLPCVRFSTLGERHGWCALDAPRFASSRHEDDAEAATHRQISRPCSFMSAHAYI
jgi:hypothetical protein